MNGVELTAIKRRKPIGKTPTIKRQARELDSDVEFILDADTVLEIGQLHRAHRPGAVSGRRHLPVRSAPSCRSARRTDVVRGQRSGASVRIVAAPQACTTARPVAQSLRRGITNLYRETLYLFFSALSIAGSSRFSHH